MKIVHGDLIALAKDGAFDAIIHGCNCFHTMRSGIAASIRKEFPAAYVADKQTVCGDRRKLGTVSSASVMVGDRKLIVVNAYTQFAYGRHQVQVDYASIGRAMAQVRAQYHGLRIGYPRIGAGLAGGDWGVIALIIDCELNGEDHTLVEYRL